MEKVIAMYLPQFYETPENNEWWGKGFTEWISARNAKSLFEGHYQPHIPLNENYYNLLDKRTMINQANLMKKYNVYGMCFYHYWFKDGRQMLEKPAENLLKWTDVDMPFCFSWANESWTRTWSNVDDKNVWVSLNESKEQMIKNPSGILLEQQYGEEEDWQKHFEYLKTFFADKRYIKIDNKPIFLIYRPSLIGCFNDMKQLWNKLAIQEGFDGIYFIACNTLNTKNYDKVLLQEPQYTMRENPYHPYDSNKNVRGYYDYEEVWKKIIQRKFYNDNILYGGFVGYDDTPRREKGGIVIDQSSPNVFKKYLKILLKKNEIHNNEFVWINAWNEWGEGMHLEPDQKYGYKYLEAIKQALEEYDEVELMENKDEKEDMTISDDFRLLRYESYWRSLHQWMILKEESIELCDYLKSKDINKIAIYGMGMLGKHLLAELKNTDIDIVYGIDENAKNLLMDIPVVEVAGNYDMVDLIIVTVVYDYDTIKEKLKKYTTIKTISLLELLKSAENDMGQGTNLTNVL